MPRIMLTLIAVIGLALGAMSASAHVGHDAPGLHVELERVDRFGSSLQIALMIENGTDDAVLLAGFSTALGLVKVTQAPSQIAAGEAAQVKLTLQVEGEMPGLFTLIVDFGPAGSGPVLIFTGA